MDERAANAELFAQLKTARTTKDVVAIALDAVPSICVCDGAAVALFSNGHCDLHASGALERAAVHYLALPPGSDPLCARMRATCAPIDERELFGEDAWHDQLLYRRVAGPHELEHYVLAPLIGNCEPIGAIAAVRGPRLSAFAATERTGLAIAALHISLALAHAPDCEPVAMVSMQSLTRREKQIAVFVSRGLDNPEIARQLGISVNTVKKYLKTMFEQLGVSRRAELASLVTMARLL